MSIRLRIIEITKDTSFSFGFGTMLNILCLASVVQMATK